MSNKPGTVNKQIRRFVITPDLEIDIPDGSTILSIRGEQMNIVLWASVDPSTTIVRRKFTVIRTGGEIPSDNTLDFIGTIHLTEGTATDMLDLHVFELVK